MFRDDDDDDDKFYTVINTARSGFIDVYVVVFASDILYLRTTHLYSCVHIHTYVYKYMYTTYYYGIYMHMRR